MHVIRKTSQNVILRSFFHELRKTYQTQSGISSLPRQPVPVLQETLQKYLKSVKPFVTPEEYSKTEKLISDFKVKGQKLQSYLEEKAKNEENWLLEWWLNVGYLEFRKPVVVWSSPGLVFPSRTFNSAADQLTYAANVLHVALRYKDMIDRGNIKTDTAGNNPMDMSQYSKIFGTCRIPQAKRDKLIFEDLNNRSDHIIVAHNNNFFKLVIRDENSNFLTVDELYDNLLEIVECSLDKVSPVGILTSADRDTWSKAYEILSKENENKETLDIIQKSLFLLCLDNVSETKTVNQQTRAGLQTVHGGGSKENTGNRWFDKTVQFIVNRNGDVGLTYEHSPAEGQPLAIMMDFIVDELENNAHKVDTSTTRNSPIHYKKLSFSVTPELEEFIKKAEKDIDNLVDDLDMYCFTYEPYGKKFVKSHKMSPDSYIQMSLQYAFYRLHKVPGAQYETGSTRKYLHGRTETIRSCSTDSVLFAQRMLDKSVDVKEKIVSLQNAIKSHKEYTKQAMEGLGVDRHLLGLKLAALEMGLEVPELYSDPAYLRSSHMRVSTSQVASKCNGFMCYGPLVNDGYACCYNPREDTINFGTSAFRNCEETNIDSFKASLEESLNDMKKLFE